MSKSLIKTADVIGSLITLTLVIVSTGCTAVLTPMTGTPVTRVPDELLGIRRSEYVPVPVVMLARPRPEEYIIDDGDILAVYIRGILPYSDPGSVPPAPPVNFNNGGGTLPPSIGFPIPVQDKGIVNLPLLAPVSVKGLTVEQARDKIVDQYRSKEIIRTTDEAPIVSIMKEREHNILVLRAQANGGSDRTGITGRNDQASTGFSIDLPFYKSDVLNALTATGGLPGVNEKNEVTIFRTSKIPYDRRNEVIAQLMASGGRCQPCVTGCFGETNAGIGSSSCFAYTEGMVEDEIVTRIPLRMPPGQTPVIQPSDIELEDGDIVMVESRETEFFYTGGLLRGGQYLLPRDYDLDVLGALAIAGSGLTSQSGQSGGGGGGMGGLSGLGGPSPSLLYIIRKLPCGRTYNIMVDIQQAMNDSSQNILVQPGDTLILRYKPHEELTNFGIGTFFTFGIRELFRD
ncbi:polysaccharide biosynthesis/export family protein [Roseiconus lacunae]|uniref:Polysaccharide biosynthesis/export family protein n=1 Tax=Roseiconus lacunae TaxID=2605694 RepID=A0ABT7PND6_9BACT|nr:polysaccharide biosynthesis/export family protein [Roseiconus lacunae]MCD0459026.1 polysaccharide biosynthesis/export family protein [Roseiconus lacunae]MDM4018029.1 polysaccharide biosynthesis/export family protein [Roseiconus lacunae]WRQ50730.1 polysaccharide biosynthesis/export family protein [Stieleria sp. HD01]